MTTPVTYQSSRAAASAIGKYSAVGVWSDTVSYKFAHATANFGQGNATADILQLFKVPGASSPNGITILGLDLYFEALGGGLSVDVGDPTTQNNIMHSQSLVSAGIAHYGAGTTPVASTGVGFPQTYTTDTTIQMTVTASNGNVDGTITAVLWMTGEPIGS